MSRYLPAVAAVILLAAVAVVQGVWTERWAEFPELEIYAKQLEKVPLQIGEWIGEDAEESETNKRMLEIAGAVGSLSRVYRNDRNDMVQVFIVCGRLDDVFAHTPDRCYPAAGFETNGDIVKKSVEIGKDVADFKSAMYLKSEPGGNQNLRVYWSFCADGPWIAPEQHRWEFAGARALYKLYVVAPSATSEIPVDNNPAVDFIHVFIPELDKAIEPAFAAAKELAGKGTNAAAKSTPTPESTTAPAGESN